MNALNSIELRRGKRTQIIAHDGATPAMPSATEECPPCARFSSKLISCLRLSSVVQSELPERLAQALAGPFDLAYVSHPARLPEIAINVFWHAKYHKDPANEWLRGLVFRIHSD